MINTDMRFYPFFTIGEDDEYGQAQVSSTPSGAILMSVNILNQAVADNVNYSEATYIGLTMDKTLNNGYIIQYGNKRLKVLYVNPKGRYNQVYLGEYDNGAETFKIDGGLI
jgi:hypothetical protein